MSRRSTQKGQKKGGYRGSLGSASIHGAFTSGASQELKQMGGVHSRATQKFLNKALKRQKNMVKAANAAKKTANHAAAEAKKAANNAQRALNAANAIHRATMKQKANNEQMVQNLVSRFEKVHSKNKYRTASPFVPQSVQNQNAHYQKMVNDLVGK